MAHEQTKVKTSSLGTGSITTTHIPDGAITSAKLGSGTISNSKSGLTASEPTFSSLTPTIADPNSNTTITITGTNFVAVPQVWWLNTGTGARTRSGVVSFTSSTEITAQFPSGLAAGTYQAIIENATGLGVKGSTNITNSIAPNWITSAGSLGSITEGESVSTSVLAVDDDSTAVSSYALTSGALPSGVSLNTSTGAITGTMPLVNADTIYNFTITATDDESQQTARAFSLTATDFAITNSLMFNKADNPELSRATGDGNERVGTFSFWFKPAAVDSGCIFYSVYVDSSNFFDISCDGSMNFQVRNKASGSYNMEIKTSRVFRDPTAWYHICVIVDTTQATNTNRCKIYINGTQETAFATSTYPSQNTDLIMNSNSKTARISSSQDRMHGYLSEFVLIDGTAKVVGDFGELDSDTPTIWKPKAVSGLSGDKGVNGFYLDYKDSANLGNCAFSGTDFTETNLAATDQSTDTPANNFATQNGSFQTGIVFSEGNLVSTYSTNAWQWSPSSMAFESGKWYAEVKVLAHNYSGIGLTDLEDAYGYAPSDTHPGKTAVTPNGRGFFWYHDDGKIYYNDTSMTGPGAFSTGDILMFAIDMTNNKYHFGINGTWKNSSDPANNTGGFTHQSGGTWTFFNAVGNGGSLSWNYGSPAYAISSSNSDANGYGSFEYTVPTGFFALNSKNLAEYG